MNRSTNIYLGFISAVILFLANASGVPQAVTGAPGESGFSCNACHSGGNFNTQISIDLLQDGNPVSAYKAGETYQLRVQVSGQNNPKSFGFELVCLKASDNSDLGVWTQLGDRIRTRNMLSRVYLQQSAPKSDGIFTAYWKAPLTDVGPVNFYFSGLAVNLNGDISGDQHAMSSFILPSSATSTSNDITTDNLNIKIYPVPSTDIIYIDMPGTVCVKITGMNGSHLSFQYNSEKGIDISELSAGIYFVRIENSAGQYAGKAKFIKI